MTTSFIWDSQTLFKFDGKVFVWLIHEPWTMNWFWEVQVGSQFY